MLNNKLIFTWLVLSEAYVEHRYIIWLPVDIPGSIQSMRLHLL